MSAANANLPDDETMIKTQGPHGRPIEILLVEDNYGDTLLAKEAFKSSKFINNITVASDGDEALVMLRGEAPYTGQRKPDLILLDLNLPKRDGREVLEMVKSDPLLRHIPVVVLTGSRAQAEIAGSYAQHANAYVVKPVNFERLKEIVSTIEEFWFSIVTMPEPVEEKA
jgi:two-component system, chemotaxis family, response regulator Rcp1